MSRHAMRARRIRRDTFLATARALAASPSTRALPAKDQFRAWVERWRIGPGMNDLHFAHMKGLTLPADARYSGFDGAVGPGWIPLLDRLCDALYRHGWDGGLDQVKEKYGTLRFYLRYTAGTAAQHRRWDRAVQRAEWASGHTCDRCGARVTTRAAGGWYATRCDACEAARAAEWKARATESVAPASPTS